MSKLLIISYLFAPTSAIGAVRWTKLAKYMALDGYDVDVLTTSAKAPEDKLLAQDAAGAANVNIIRIDHADHKFDETVYYKDQQSAASLSGGQKKPLSRRIKDMIWKSRLLKYPTAVYAAKQNFDRSRDFAKQAQKYIKNSLDLAAYDAVICTYGPVCGTMMGLWLKKNYPDVPLIMDFRDPMVSDEYPFPYHDRYAAMQKKACAAADRIVIVSDGFRSRICGDKHAEKTVVITNGYDTRDFEDVPELEDPRWSFVCTVGAGGLYGGKADYSPLFRALAGLFESGDIDRKNVVFHHIGHDRETMLAQAEKYGVGDIIEYHGRVPRIESIAWQRSMRHVVIATENYVHQHGRLPGKLLEALNSGSPIIGLVSGDMSGSTMETMLQRGRLGVTYENAAAEADYPVLCSYLAEDCRRWKQGLDPVYDPDKDYVTSFSYPELAKRVESVVKEIKN